MYVVGYVYFTYISFQKSILLLFRGSRNFFYIYIYMQIKVSSTNINY